MFLGRHYSPKPSYFVVVVLIWNAGRERQVNMGHVTGHASAQTQGYKRLPRTKINLLPPNLSVCFLRLPVFDKHVTLGLLLSRALGSCTRNLDLVHRR